MRKVVLASLLLSAFAAGPADAARVVRTWDLAPSERGVVWSQTLGRVLVLDFANWQWRLTHIDVATRQQVAQVRFPEFVVPSDEPNWKPSLALDDARGRLFAVDDVGIRRFDGTFEAVSSSVAFPAITATAVDPATGNLIVASGSRVSILDGGSLSTVRTIVLAEGTVVFDLDVHGATGAIFVACYPGGQPLGTTILQVLSARTGAIIRSVQEWATAVVVDQPSGRAFVTWSHAIDVYDPTGTRLKHISSGMILKHPSIDPVRRRILVPTGVNDSVFEIDAVAMEITGGLSPGHAEDFIGVLSAGYPALWTWYRGARPDRFRLVSADEWAPVTTLTATPMNGTEFSGGFTRWTTGNWAISVSCADEDGCETTKVKVNGLGDTYAGPFELTAEGISRVSYWSWDRQENIETLQAESFGIDRTPPVTDLDGPQAVVSASRNIVLTGWAIDPATAPATASGVVSVCAQVTPTVLGAAWCVPAEVVPGGYRVALSLSAGAYRVQMTARDLVGNASQGRVLAVVSGGL